ncbi:tRNA (cmo5U34)-methyltransferase [Sphingobium wenxiniae]|uniref:tRNA (Cmo5U34)-methyltransferase n=1 Tax=Sphingobium wenxiniae (strain DSM 21828 / CGMCC 1.7748 / JZ-1) TaxID=595605 RepID=A0A562K903_SPHWJ|nr:class I SAM-dependent methyltransferase [Sphingobium wenxiniae]MBB6192399.1 tRNA (cmo5U34)-methyltransferase [Sphingobium wenxiniae]TWH91909.1 tRNA (cmo5U34)-methyltransferase [Sphingobium wenxiniae]
MDTLRPFTDAAAVARYAEDTPRKVPGYADLHRMAMLLLAERAPPDADILVYGAGGGLELKAFGEAQSGWRLVGVDPSAEMLDLARETLGPLQRRVDLRQGYIDAAPQGPFDGAACLLTLHFLQRDERQAVLRDIRRRMKPGARLVIAHHSYPQGSEPQAWLARSALFADRGMQDVAGASRSAQMMSKQLPILSSGEEEGLLEQAGFSEIALFYAAFSFRGWAATA